MSKKIVIIFSIIFLIILYMSFFQSNEKDMVNSKQTHNSQSGKPLDKQQTIKAKISTPNKIVKQSDSTKELNQITNKSIPHYKDIFKESKEFSTLVEVQNEQEIRNLDKQSSDLISEADAFIKKNHLIIPQKKLTSEQIKNDEKFNEEMDALKDELKELSNDKSK